MCFYMEKYGKCKFGENCDFAHTKEKLDNKSNLGISSAGKTSKFEIIYMNLFLYRQVGILSTLI